MIIIYFAYKVLRHFAYKVLRHARQTFRTFIVRPVKIAASEVLKYPLMTAAIGKPIRDFQPQVIHAHDLWPLPGTVKVAAQIGANVVYDAHELEKHRNGQRRLARWLTAYNERRYIKHADEIITVCDSIAEYLSDYYKVKRPLVVMNAPDLTKTRRRRTTVRSDIGLPPETPLSIYVGSVTIFRGLEQTIEALVHCKEFHLVALGPGLEKVKEAVRALAHRLGVSARFHLLNSVPPYEVVSYIRNADVGVIPTQDVCLSYRYSLPNKLFEMTFAGLPLCISNLVEQRRFVELAGNGLVMNEQDPRDIARVMREVYDRRKELTLSNSALERLARKYAWHAQGQKLVEAYDALSNVAAANA